MKCPHCKDTNLVMSERKGVEIDYCPDCRGVWLDRGELDKIIEKSQAEAPTPPQEGPQGYPQPAHAANTYQQPTPGYGYQKPYKRKKSFFEELFD